MTPRAFAARWWQSLLDQEDGFGAFTEQLSVDMARFGAPATLCDWAREIVGQEARHVEICTNVIAYFGVEPQRRRPEKPKPMESDHALAEAIVAGFAVGETMSVGGFTASLALAKDPLTRQTLKELARDEVRHGRFGEVAGQWALRDWAADQRRSLWGPCVYMMESFERRCGGVESIEFREGPFAEALGAPAPRVTHRGLLRAVERLVLPRLARLGVLPPRDDQTPSQRTG